MTLTPPEPDDTGAPQPEAETAAETAAEPRARARARAGARAAARGGAQFGRTAGEALLRGLRPLGTALTVPTGAEEPLLAHAPKRWMRLLPYALAVALVAALIPSSTQVYANDYGVRGGVAAALAVGQAAPLLLAVTRPLPAWWIVIVCDTLGALVLLGVLDGQSRPWPWPAPVIVGYLMLCLALALRENRRTLLSVWLVTAALSLAFGFLATEHNEGTNVLLIVLSGVVLLLGAVVRERGEVQRRLAEQETISEAERARRTLLEERARIARELHDVVAHHMSVITVQADSAPYRIGGLPGEAAEEFGAIAATARESLAEMRRLLGVLRSEETKGERAPQPGLERLEQLVEATVRAGVPTELSVEVGAGLAALPQAVQLSAYRIVQEALANVVRHAPGAVTRVSVRDDASDGAPDNRPGDRPDSGSGGRPGDRPGDGSGNGPDDRPDSGPEGASPASPPPPSPAGAPGGPSECTGTLTVLVVNGPSPAPHTPPLESSGTGHGLVGMRERVRLVGGTLDTGPLPGGGFRVAAALPLHPLHGKESSPS